jgi:MFS family permease
VIAIGVVMTFAAGIVAWSIDTYAPSIAGFVGTWTLFAFGIAFVFPGSYGAVLSAARTDAGLAAGVLGAAQMLAGAAGSALSGVLPGSATEELGILALAGSAVGAAGYALSKPALCQQRKLTERAADDR